LEQEIRKLNAGVFDDIQVFENDEYQFYQVKHSINIIGDLITYDDLINPEIKISIQKIYFNLTEIKDMFDNFSIENSHATRHYYRIKDKLEKYKIFD